jgi:hypothetical protein
MNPLIELNKLKDAPTRIDVGTVRHYRPLTFYSIALGLSGLAWWGIIELCRWVYWGTR